MLELEGMSLFLESVNSIEKKSSTTRSTPAKCLRRLNPAHLNRSILSGRFELTASGILSSSRIEK